VDPGHAGDADVLKQLHAALERYGGWLNRERTAATVRADIQALGAAIHAGTDPSPLLETLDGNIARLPGGELRKMMRQAARQMRRALTDAR
jgi:hypothetical protein